MSNFNNGYQAFHNVANKIFSYLSPCSIDSDSMIIAPSNSNQTLLKLVYYSNYQVVLSIFVNATEQENIHYNLTENIQTAESISYEKHYLCKKGKEREIKTVIPINLESIKQINTKPRHSKVIDRRYQLIIRMEPKDYKHRFVNMYYFNVIDVENESGCRLVKHKIEIKNKTYYIYDIFGLENLKAKFNQDSMNKYCSICLDNQIAVIIIPCRHMCLCLTCAMLYNEKDANNKNKMKPECPVCRGLIKSFINIQGLEVKEN